MQVMLKHSLLLIFCLVHFSIYSQITDSSYTIYLEQFIELSNTRALQPTEIQKTIKDFKSNNLNSNEDFAKLCSRLYPKDKGIGILLYFFHRDTLKRVFVEPGNVIEETAIPIKKEALLKLSDDLNYALNLYNLTANRAPTLRGGIRIDKKEENTGQSLSKITSDLTSLLLPSKFSDKYRHLIIIPCLNIGVLPFHLLKPYKDDSYLIDKCSFTIAPTLVDFVGLRSRVIKALGMNVEYIKDFDVAINSTDFAEGLIKFSIENPLFISNPDYPKNSEYFFPDLPGAEREIDSALRYAARYSLLKGKEASKALVIESLNHSDIAYFATHGMSNAENPKDKSYLVLSGDDPFLTSKEIQDLRLKKDFAMPELVILSACQTGLGKATEAGIAGSLARSFILSGSNQVITSLWSVDDNATAYLMNRFFFHLANSEYFIPAEHLRKAILDTKNKFPNPAHWASFSLVGVDYGIR
ncbi:CHAT domain-containing protein [Flavisolibacter tropicus]|uniref:CHAT domain-containing protein n=1 Tax=Flavisolibacter tropicus TaxID=1492898 RepID=A0A172TTM9_9BACT|nr:CHAT domain-containing protein [Flavisolibacter tropicus]ANE50445.1 hypothetical protein SY85_08005 [Flavisolibacter tropicus]